MIENNISQKDRLIILNETAKKQVNNTGEKYWEWYGYNHRVEWCAVFTQRADAQQLLNYTSEQIKKRNKQAAGTAAVMGGTEESLAAEKAANASAMAETASKIAAEGANRRDNIDAAYLEGMQGTSCQRRSCW